jgi:hypothetical protein
MSYTSLADSDRLVINPCAELENQPNQACGCVYRPSQIQAILDFMLKKANNSDEEEIEIETYCECIEDLIISFSEAFKPTNTVESSEGSEHSNPKTPTAELDRNSDTSFQSTSTLDNPLSKMDNTLALATTIEKKLFNIEFELLKYRGTTPSSPFVECEPNLIAPDLKKNNYHKGLSLIDRSLVSTPSLSAPEDSSFSYSMTSFMEPVGSESLTSEGLDKLNSFKTKLQSFQNAVSDSSPLTSPEIQKISDSEDPETQKLLLTVHQQQMAIQTQKAEIELQKQLYQDLSSSRTKYYTDIYKKLQEEFDDRLNSRIIEESSKFESNIKQLQSSLNHYRKQVKVLHDKLKHNDNVPKISLTEMSFQDLINKPFLSSHAKSKSIGQLPNSGLNAAKSPHSQMPSQIPRATRRPPSISVGARVPPPGVKRPQKITSP